MTVEADQTTGDAGRRDVSGTVITVLLSMVHGQNGDVGTAQALALAGERRSFSALRDAGAWSSLSEAVALFNAAALVTGDGAVGLHVGERLLTWPEEAPFVGQLVALGSPEAALTRVAALAEHFETESQASVVELAPDHALVRVSPRSAASRHAHLCEMTRGLLAQVPALFGLAPALVSETECSARGGRFCLYALSWDDPDTAAEPDPGATSFLQDWPAVVVDEPPPPFGGERPEKQALTATARSQGIGGHATPAERAPLERATPADRATPTHRRVSELEEELDRMVAELDRVVAELDSMGVLLDGALGTAAELLNDDVDALLDRVARGADDVVGSHQYLLMVRVRPGAPLQIHHRGLLSDEAQILAAELWRDDPDDADGTRIIVDIASPQRLYGRLVELTSPDTRPAAARALELYAGYAAAALDIFGVLTDARRSDATGQALLSFSEALSGASSTEEVVQLLADTVPTVTGCDRAAVYLWDGGTGRLVPRAGTRGESRAGAIGPAIVPLRPSGRSGSTPWAAGVRRIEDATGPVTPGSPGAEPTAEGSAIALDTSDVAAVRTDSPLFDSLVRQGEVVVIDQATDDPELRRLLTESDVAASVVAPLFANRDFLGVVAAVFETVSPAVPTDDPDLHVRLAGLADQAATALQNRELLEQVSHMAWHDVLTELPNRRLFEDRVQQELVRSRRVGEPVCMFFVDIDHFKTVNDTLGHAAGDDLIRQVGQRLVDTVRRQDTVARVGGDEFAILLPGLSDQGSIDQLAQRSLEALSTPYLVFDQEVPSSASIGIAMAPEHGDSYDELLSHADEAMYRAKSLGRNAFQMYSRLVVDGEDGDLAVDDRTLHADLVNALARHEFFVVYQPYIDLHTDRVVGVEALVRWSHPRLGTLEPSAFIAVAERSDVIVSLDAWVIGQTCRQARLWLDSGLPPLRLSVNLASRDLSDPVLFDNVEGALAETGLDPSSLELEITERVVLDKNGPARENIERLRRLGVRFSIDDFGTGRSSLSRIGSFPVSTIKIDQSFIQVLGPDTEKNSLVSAIVSMADRLGLACVAEGVETSLQSRVLLQRGCTTAQGYFFSPPLLPDDVETMMTAVASADGRFQVVDGQLDVVGGLDADDDWD
jgi:diguanylate cyclase (GGDEF)-like protein